MNYFYILNLCIVLTILYRISIGWKRGLFNESTNLAIFLFSSGLSIAFFEVFAGVIRHYFCRNEDISIVISFVSILIGTFAILWVLKFNLMEKALLSAYEKRILFPKLLDKLGGAICGLTLGALMLSFFILSLYMAPIPNDFYEETRIKNEVLFHLDEFLPRSYGAMLQIPFFQAEFNYEDFLNKYRKVVLEDLEEKEEKEKEEHEEVNI